MPKRGPLANSYAGAVALVICALVPYLMLSAAMFPLLPLISKSVGLSKADLNLAIGPSNAGYAFGTVLRYSSPCICPRGECCSAMSARSWSRRSWPPGRHDTLASAGERVTLYHAGLASRERHDAMTAFLGGSARVIAATVAFSMGIDKPDVRWILHFDPPPSLDAYYQESGRADRDGQPARARLLYRYEDFEMARHLTARGVSDAAVDQVAAALAAGQRVEPGGRQRTAALVRLADLLRPGLPRSLRELR